MLIVHKLRKTVNIFVHWICKNNQINKVFSQGEPCYIRWKLRGILNFRD